MYGLSDDLIDYRDRAIKLAEALRFLRSAWRIQLQELEAVKYDTSAEEFRIRAVDERRAKIKWITEVLND